MNDHSLPDTLQRIHFLHDIPQTHLEEITKVAGLRNFDELEVIFREGDLAEHVYLVVSGKVSLEMCAPGIGCKRILTVGPGDLLGWSALLDHTRLTSTARTVEKTQVIELDAAKLLAVFKRDLEFAYEFMRRTLLALAKRLSATRMQLLDVYGSQLPAAYAAEEDDGR
jgi:CRP-like cAMP-binding protein